MSKLTDVEIKLKRKLDYHYRYFDKTKISPDPLEFPHRFSDELDIEISAFVSSVFAYGNILQIINTLEKLHKIMGESPLEFILNFNFKLKSNPFRNIKHRFFTGEDIYYFFNTLNIVYKSYGSLKKLFLLYYYPDEENLKISINNFSENLLDIWRHTSPLTRGAKFFFPMPRKGSACKRMNLFLRWMVRNDELDFGLWKEIDTAKLIIPVDTHVAKISRELKLCRRKIVSWKMAEEITNSLKIFNPKDPVKYDFAICHIGMRKMKFDI